MSVFFFLLFFFLFFCQPWTHREELKFPVVGNRLSHTFYPTNICVVQTLLEAQHIFLNFDNICCKQAQKTSRYCMKLSWTYSFNLKAGRCGREWGSPFTPVMSHDKVWAPLTNLKFPTLIFWGFIYTQMVQTCLFKPKKYPHFIMEHIAALPGGERGRWGLDFRKYSRQM